VTARAARSEGRARDGIPLPYRRARGPAGSPGRAARRRRPARRGGA
jgi:hypothetical protein